MVFRRFIIIERCAYTKLRPPAVKSAQRLGLVDIEDEDDSIHAAENTEERGEKRSNPAVS